MRIFARYAPLCAPGRARKRKIPTWSERRPPYWTRSICVSRKSGALFQQRNGLEERAMALTTMGTSGVCFGRALFPSGGHRWRPTRRGAVRAARSSGAPLQGPLGARTALRRALYRLHLAGNLEAEWREAHWAGQREGARAGGQLAGARPREPEASERNFARRPERLLKNSKWLCLFAFTWT